MNIYCPKCHKLLDEYTGLSNNDFNFRCYGYGDYHAPHIFIGYDKYIYHYRMFFFHRDILYRVDGDLKNNRTVVKKYSNYYKTILTLEFIPLHIKNDLPQEEKLAEKIKLYLKFI